MAGIVGAAVSAVTSGWNTLTSAGSFFGLVTAQAQVAAQAIQTAGSVYAGWESAETRALKQDTLKLQNAQLSEQLSFVPLQRQLLAAQVAQATSPVFQGLQLAQMGGSVFGGFATGLTQIGTFVITAINSGTERKCAERKLVLDARRTAAEEKLADAQAKLALSSARAQDITADAQKLLAKCKNDLTTVEMAYGTAQGFALFTQGAMAAAVQARALHQDAVTRNDKTMQHVTNALTYVALGTCTVGLAAGTAGLTYATVKLITR